MTKEELKNKCKERAKIFQQAMECCKSSSPMDCIEWFADRIAELEKENAELRAKESFVGDQNRKLCEQQQKIEVLEAENAELKKQLESERDLPAIAYMQGAEKQKKKDEEQITIAKVALRNVVDYLGQFCSDYPDCVIEAEKILKECK